MSSPALAPLVYVFCHWPAPGVGLAARARRRQAFHDALAGAVPGLLASASFQVEPTPWTAGREPIEDWYAVADWTALGVVNHEAVRGPRAEPHRLAAATVSGATAGLFQVAAGTLDAFELPWTHWFAKPAGVAYDELYAGLEPVLAARSLLLRRQMNLGPTTEFCLVVADPVRLPMGIVAL